ncbi:hypothetical protein BCV69DRAFT_112785 [Microstroma glucosiphilum]|uniref:Autophagy-related protein 11 n=1 Tax=Pseudomicrostroma glucosiphilum TaxID=1684307 RepID=A0A316UEA2_9BASI|nr:hypothetical protein BCV69DRAFT_112785 [Pseudomicrostroma glucosiphilum]PWN23238.1 hypothetical protein BCV69DRAFT_112785 [Pseudomicrostroma glucosiphilum]
MMIRINRAHDGKVIEVKQALSQFNSIDDLLHAISLATAIPSDGIICMTGDGAQLNDELLATLSTEDQGQTTEFFVFNRDFLYTDVDVLSQDLAVEPALAPAPSSIDLVQPPTPRSLEAIVAWSHSILEYVHSHASTSQHHHSALSTIQRSTSVALLNLLSHSHNVKDGSLSAKVSNEGQLGRMQRLLGGYQRDLEILGLVRVNPALLPPSSGSSSKRTLGDFVSRVKMGAVADACNRVFEELQSQQNELAGNSSQLEADTRDLTSEVEGTSIDPSTETLEEALQAETRAEELTAYLVDTCSPDSNGWPVADKLDGSTINEIQQAVEELYLLDEVARESVRRLTADKNDMTARCLSLLGDISSLQSDYADLSAGLAAFDTELKSGRVDGFRHLTRLNNMLWAYGATVIEIVRRREFTKYFLAKSQALAELMAKASSRERKRRNKYRTSIAGQLPWEVKGMDEAPPSLEISTSRSTETTPELDRQDLQGLLQLIGEIEDTLAKADAISGDSSGGPLARSKKDLQELIARLDSLDDEFAVLVEKNLLGLDEDWEGGSEDGNGSDSSDGDMIKKPTRRRVNNGSRAGDDILAITQKENERLQQENRDLNKQAEAREMSDHQRYQSELTALRSECSAARLENRRLKEELNSVTREKASAMSEVETLRGDVDLERERRLNMQEELSLLRKEAQAARKEEEQARREASEEAERLAEAELHVQDLQNELEEARAARIDASNRIESLLSEGSNVEKELSAAQEHIEDLLAQLGQARQDAREARDAHAEAEATKERLVRSHRAEADGDRAILEENLREHRSELETARAELERIKDTTKAEVEAAQTLRGQLRGADEAHEELVKTMEAAKDASAEAELAMRHPTKSYTSSTCAVFFKVSFR